jgi:hypothetical protein
MAVVTIIYSMVLGLVTYLYWKSNLRTGNIRSTEKGFIHRQLQLLPDLDCFGIDPRSNHNQKVHICTAQHCTALHSTAQHCTAQHCTAQQCTAQQCTALHSLQFRFSF